MKLIKLSCDQPSFKTITFNPEGLTLIVGDGSNDKTKEGSSNGVGKTLALGLIHHCLGANANPKLSASVPDWIFRLDFSLGQNTHTVERSGNGKSIYLDGMKTSIKKLREWLNTHGPFRLNDSIERITFRSLLSRFARYNRADCMDPVLTNRESEYDGLLRSLYLLGADLSLVVSKRENKLLLDDLKKTSTNWKDDVVLRNMFRAGAKPKVRYEWLSREIPRIKSDLEKFRVAEDYRQIELTAGELTKDLRRLEKEQAILQFQAEGIEKSLAQHPDITRENLLALYKGLESTFKPEALAHFDAVERFHNTLFTNRQQRLEQERLKVRNNLRALEEQRVSIAKERDKLIQSLHGKRALDEYAAMARALASYEEEKERLEDFLSFSDNLQDKIQTAKEKKLEEDRVAADYSRTNPLERQDDAFKALAEHLYPGQPAGIVLENNTGDNQLRYSLSVHIEGDDSDGINAARIICFDWVLLMHGANHSIDFLWHDNRLFADIDPRPRAQWFKHALSSIDKTGKQYIVSINTENYLAMMEYIPEHDKAALEQSIRLLLRGDNAANKLLGIQFGSA